MYIRKQSHDGTLYTLDLLTGREYGKIIAGIGWGSGKRRPFIYVVGVSVFKDAILSQHSFHVLSEYEARDSNDLFVKCLTFKRTFCIEEFYGDMTQEAMMNALYQFNGERERNNEIDFLPAPNSELPDSGVMYLDLIRKLTNPKCRRIDFARVPGFEISEEAMEFPSFRALGHALAALQDYETPKADEPRNPSRAKTDFNIFDNWDKNPKGNTGEFNP